jgi:hypothetical protein
LGDVKECSGAVCFVFEGFDAKYGIDVREEDVWGCAVEASGCDTRDL